MSEFLNFVDFEATAKKEPANSSEKPSKIILNEKNEQILKKKKKMATNISDPSILEADLLNESYSEISNNQIIRVIFRILDWIHGFVFRF